MACNIETLIEIYERDLGKLEEEIKAYNDEDSVWKVAAGINNSAGNLCLHLCGNLQHFIGATLGGTGYVRDRDAEFAMRNISKEKLIDEISTTRKTVRQTLKNMRDEQLNNEYPLPVLGGIHKTEFFLVHLASHLNYHLGQINYHRRLLVKSPGI